MNATTMTWTIRFAWVLLAMLALGVVTAPGVGAEPNNGTKPPSITSRVKTFDDLCETIGGGTSSVNYSYENGKLVGANASCKGGSQDRYNCTYTADSTKCYTAPKQSAAATTRVPVGVVLTEGTILADPVATTGGILFVDPALGDAGPVEGVVAEAQVESTPASEPVILVIAAEPGTIQLLEDEQE